MASRGLAIGFVLGAGVGAGGCYFYVKSIGPAQKADVLSGADVKRNGWACCIRCARMQAYTSISFGEQSVRPGHATSETKHC